MNIDTSHGQRRESSSITPSVHGKHSQGIEIWRPLLRACTWGYPDKKSNLPPSVSVVG